MSPESCVPKPACITLGLRPELEGVITVWVALFLTLLTLVQWCMTLTDMGLTHSGKSLFPNICGLPLLLFFWLKWAGYLAVAGLNLLAQISDRISPYGV